MIPAPLTAALLAFAAGAWWLQQQADLPSLAWAWAVLPPVVIAFLLRGEGRLRRAGRLSFAVAAGGLAGFFWAATLAAGRLAESLPVEWEGRDVEVIAVISDLPRRGAKGTRFELEVERVMTASAVVPRKLLVTWFDGREAPGGETLRSPVRAAERWRLTLRLRRPHGNANPHGFDYEAWLLERGIRATGYVRDRPAPERIDAFAGGPGPALERAREAIRERFLGALGDRPYAGVLVALAVGDQAAIPPEQWRVFTRTGVNHLMSISGLHVTMVSGLAFALVAGLWRRQTALALRLPARRAGAVAAVLAALGYALLAGFAVPAQRTFLMVAVVAAALWAGWASAGARVLALALFAVTLYDPWAVLAPGFWLSFGAVAAIFFVASGRIGRPGWLRGWWETQWAVTVALAPMLIALFGQVSIVSPLANAVAIPLVSFVVVPLVLLAAAVPWDPLLLLAHGAFAACMAALEVLSAAPDAVWQQHAPPPWAVVLAAAGAVWLLLPRGFPARWLGAVAFLPLFLARPEAPAPGELRVTVLDVGQGLATVLRTANHALVYDTGPDYAGDSDAGGRIVVPYLRGEAIARLDGLVVSHDDEDHHGGARSIRDALPVARVWSSLAPDHPAVAGAADRVRCEHGQGWEWDGVRFEILHPGPASYDDGRLRDNDRSCVLRASAGSTAVLLPGDVEARGETALLAAAGSGLGSVLLVAPHHGGKNTSGQALIDAAGPEIVVFTAGYRNRYGHPWAEVVERYRAAGAIALRSDSDGAVEATLAPEGLAVVRTWRGVHRRYWQEPAAGIGEGRGEVSAAGRDP